MVGSINVQAMCFLSAIFTGILLFQLLVEALKIFFQFWHRNLDKMKTKNCQIIA